MLLQDLGTNKKYYGIFRNGLDIFFGGLGQTQKQLAIFLFVLFYFFRHHLYHKWKIINITSPSSYGANMDAVNQFLFKRFTGVENMTSDNVVKG